MTSSYHQQQQHHHPVLNIIQNNYISNSVTKLVLISLNNPYQRKRRRRQKSEKKTADKKKKEKKMFRMIYCPVQSSFPCKFDLDSDHECSVGFRDLHLVAYLKAPEMALFTEITYETLCNDRFLLTSFTPRRDVYGHLKCTVSLPCLPPGAQNNEFDTKELTFTLLYGNLKPMHILTAYAHFNVNLLVTSLFECLLTTTVRFDTSTFSMVEDNPLVVLPCGVKPVIKYTTKGKVQEMTPMKYRNFEKPHPSIFVELCDLNNVFEDGGIDLPIKRQL